MAVRADIREFGRASVRFELQSRVLNARCSQNSLSPQTQFEKLGSTKIKRKKMEALNPKKLIRRHAGVLGMSACVLAFPYDVPEFMPQVLMDLSDHLDDPQPIQVCETVFQW